MLLNSSGELSLPGKEKQPPLGVDAHHEQEAGDEQEQGEEEGGEQEGGRQGGRGAGLLLQQQDRQAAEAEKQLQERLQYNIQEQRTINPVKDSSSAQPGCVPCPLCSPGGKSLHVTHSPLPSPGLGVD